MDPNKQWVVDTSDMYPDIHSITFSGEQMERCRNAAVDVYRTGKPRAKAEYRRLYESLMKTDRVGLKSAYDSGGRQAVKQWDAFVEDTLRLAFIRSMLFEKYAKTEKRPVTMESVSSYMRYMQSTGSSSTEEDSFPTLPTHRELQEWGKVVYAYHADVAGNRKDGEEMIMTSEDVARQTVVVDMSKWVRTGARVSASNLRMQIHMVMIRKAFGADPRQAEATYQNLLLQIRDVDAEQLANQVEAGITDDALDKYMDLQDNCLQVVTLWHIIYQQPIPTLPCETPVGDVRDWEFQMQYQRKKVEERRPHLADEWKSHLASQHHLCVTPAE